MMDDKWMTGLTWINTKIQLREFTELWIKLQGVNLTEEDEIA